MPQASSRFVAIEIGYRCNNRCISCPSPSEWQADGMLSFDEVKSYIDKYRERVLTLSGGEPTIHPDFLKIVEYAAKTGTWLGILSNGRAFADKKFAETVIKTGLREACIVFHSADPELFDNFTGVKGSFIETLTGIKNLLELREKRYPFLVTLKILACKSTIKSLPATIRFISENIPRPNMVLIEALDIVSSALANQERTFITLTDAKPYIMDALTIGLVNNQNIRLYRIPPCIFPMPESYCSFIYCESEVGNMVGPPREKLDHSSAPPEAKFPCVKSPVCQECEATQNCRGVWRSYGRIMGLQELKPIRTLKLPKELRR